MKNPQRDNQSPKSPQKATNRYARRVSIFIASAIVLLALSTVFVVRLNTMHSQTIDRPISDVLNMADAHKLKAVQINGNDIFATSISGQTYHTIKEDGQPITDILRHDNVTVTVRSEEHT